MDCGATPLIAVAFRPQRSAHAGSTTQLGPAPGSGDVNATSVYAVSKDVIAGGTLVVPPLLTALQTSTAEVGVQLSLNCKCIHPERFDVVFVEEEGEVMMKKEEEGKLSC